MTDYEGLRSYVFREHLDWMLCMLGAVQRDSWIPTILEVGFFIARPFKPNCITLSYHSALIVVLAPCISSLCGPCSEFVG
jgi:hypothetical protein